jgi:lysozyme
MALRKINDAALNIIKAFESCKLAVYADQAGLPTVGWGTRVAMPIGTLVTQEWADEHLQAHVNEVCEQVSQLSAVALTDNQFGALVSFVYNLGIGSLMRSFLLKKLNAKDYSGAADEFRKWIFVGKNVSDGLVRRREAERSLFLRA